jgi:hypothetical protein
MQKVLFHVFSCVDVGVGSCSLKEPGNSKAAAMDVEPIYCAEQVTKAMKQLV